MHLEMVMVVGKLPLRCLKFHSFAEISKKNSNTRLEKNDNI